MAMSDISLTVGMRNNLLALQKTSTNLTETHVEYIIQYLKENREVTTNQDIKRIPKKI